MDATFTTGALDHLFAGLTRPFAIAVSGGADSIALMHLIAAWRRDGAGARLSAPLVLTVDHGLRAGSAIEAELAGAQARGHGWRHETLHWRGAKPSSGLQDAARQARYELMLDRLALDPSPRDLVLAHIQEDQAETLLMRLARGSGVDGLSAMRPRECRVVVALGHPVREIPIVLHRPLLDTPKSRLLTYLRAKGLPWCEDPSNADTRFERVRVRQAAAALATLGLTPESLSRSARRLRAERAVLQARTRTSAAHCVDDHGGAYGELTLSRQQTWLAPDLVRLMTPLLNVFGGASPPAQMSQIETLVDRLIAIPAQACGRLTLGGCLIEISEQADARKVRVFREYARNDLPRVRLEPGQGIFWDRRFYISVASWAKESVSVGPLGDGSKSGFQGKLPRHSLAGLPAVVTPIAQHCLFRSSGDKEVTCLWPLQHERRVRWAAIDCGA